MESTELNYSNFWWYVFVKLVTDSNGILVLVDQTPVNILVVSGKSQTSSPEERKA